MRALAIRLRIHSQAGYDFTLAIRLRIQDIIISV